MESFRCNNCGALLNGNVTKCDYCGQPVNAGYGNNSSGTSNDNNNNNNSFNYYDTDEVIDARENRVFGMLCYFGFLWLIPLFAGGKSKFVRFHLNQGLILIICDIITSMLATICNKIGMNFGGYVSLFNIVWFVFTIIGCVNALKGEKKELPVIGQFNLMKQD